MPTNSSFSIILAFELVISMIAFPLLPPIHSLGGINIARGIQVSDQNWYPAGPAMDNLFYDVFTDPGAELRAFPTSFDFTDVPLTSGDITNYQPAYPISYPSSDGSPASLDFNLANNYWGCNFNFANSACAVQIRQAFAHLIDKNAFISGQDPGQLVAIDDPAGQVDSPDPCAWDTTHAQSGSNCIVNGAGGTAYHLATAAAGNCASTPPFGWTPGCGTSDFCATADHLIAAGIASGKDPTTCVLTGIASSITSNPVHIYYRSDNTDLLHLGVSIAEGICGVLTGSFSAGCDADPTHHYLIVDTGVAAGFAGFTVFPGSNNANLNWWIYTGGDTNVAPPANIIGDEHVGKAKLSVPQTPQDWTDIVEGYVEQFTSVNAQPITGSNCHAPASSYAPRNYFYICDATYDSLANQIATAPCFSASGDPTTGQTHLTVTYANCPGTSQLTETSALYKAEDRFGQNAYLIPIYIRQNQFVYPSSWSSLASPQGRAINTWLGMFGYFNWLNAWSNAPHQAGYITQALSQSPKYLNPYRAFSPGDLGILSSVYDSLAIDNPRGNSQLIDWMAIRIDTIPNSQLSYVPPSGTVATFRYTLRNDLFWQDERKVTGWDAKFTFLTLRAAGSIFGAALNSLACTDPTTCADGVKVLTPTQFDVHVSQDTVFTKDMLSSIPILPGKYWYDPSCSSSSDWSSLAANGGVPDSCMKVGPMPVGYSACPQGAVRSDACFDPIVGGVFLGSGPWACGSGSTLGSGCAASENPGVGGTINLHRNGVGRLPGGCLSCYFRSSGDLALWVWSGNRGVFSQDFLNFGEASLCFGKPVGTPGCSVWQHGIGGSAAGTVVGLSQVSIVQRFVGVNWVAPYDWVNSPPQNIATFPPILYEGLSTSGQPVTLNPCAVDSTNGYDC